MKLGRCPVCHSNIHLDQLVADEAGRQVLNLLAKMNYKLGGAMVGYLALFRPAKQDLSNSKALTLVQETLALTSNHGVLADALSDAVAGLQQSRINGTGKQLTNHNYLKKVLAARQVQIAAEHQGAERSSVEFKHTQTIDVAEEARLFAEQMARYGRKVDGGKND